MKTWLLFFCTFFMLSSCNTPTLDLSQIKMGEDSQTYQLDKFKVYKKEKQQGHYQIKNNGNDISLQLVDDGEQVINYTFMEETVSPISFANLRINPTLGAKVVDYDGKIAFISANIDIAKTPELIKYLMDLLGTPSEVKTNARMEETMNLGASAILLKTLPQYTRKQKSEFNTDEILYPQYLIWNKPSVIYQLTLEPSNNQVGNVINIISKKALRDKVIMGFHNPEKDSVLNKYLK